MEGFSQIRQVKKFSDGVGRWVVGVMLRFRIG